jgi:alpha-tubulin suppressor-like RCC1 family protein
MMKRLLLVIGIGLGALMVACDQESTGPGTGSITVRIQVPTAVPAVASAPAVSPPRTQPKRIESDDSKEPLTSTAPPASAPAQLAGRLDGFRVTVDGPTKKTLSFNCTPTTCEGTVDGLDAGTYTVTIEGLVSNEVDSYGRTTGVTVSGGTNTPATVTVNSFRPTLADFAVTSTAAFTFTVTYSAVQNADSYIIEWAKSSSFTGPSSAAATAVSTTITVADTGTYYVRVRAVNATVSSGRASDPKTITVTLDQSPTGKDLTTAALLGTATQWNFSGRVSNVNIFPQGEQDWYKVRACTNDVLVAETFAARLNPPSNLNTLLVLRNASGAQIASNDHIDASTTYSKIQQTVTADGVYYLVVTSANTSVGQYELAVTVQPGSKNAGTKCTTTKTVVISAPQDTLVALGDKMQLTATALDTTGAPVTGATFTWASTNPAVLSVNTTGLVTAVANGSATITATESGTPGQRAIAVAQAVATVTVTPATATIAAGATQQFAATATDALGSAVAGVTYFWASNNPSVAVVDTTGLATGVASGQAIITAVGRGQPGNARLSVTAQVPAKLVFTVQPTNTVAGAAVSPAVQVTAQDPSGSTVTGFTGNVTLALGTNPSGGTLSGTTTVAAVAGVASFSNLSINKTGTGYTLIAAASGLTGTSSAAFNITTGSAVTWAFTVQPTTAAAGASISPAVKVSAQDAVGNTVTTFTSNVTVGLGANPGGGALSGTLTVTPVAGVATFSNLSINKTGIGYTLAASGSGLNATASSAFDVTAGPPNKLAFSVQPSTTVAGDAISPAIQVEIQDANGNRITTARDAVTIAIGTNPGGGTLAGTKVVNAIDGIASFTGLWINKANYSGSYILTASATGLTLDTSIGFNINPGAPAKLAFTAQPSDVQGTVAISPPVAITIRDLYDNNVTTATNQVTVSFGTNPWASAFTTGSTLYTSSGPSGLSSFASGGVATFNDLRIDKPAPGYALAGSAAGLTGASSSLFNANLTVRQVSAGGSHTCARVFGGAAPDSARAYCWGSNGSLQLGATTGSISADSVPALVRQPAAGGPIVLVYVSAGAVHSCGITAVNDAYCWGYDYYGQLGDGATVPGAPSQGQPVLVTGGHKFKSIAAGAYHTCGVTTAGSGAEDRQVYCWGYNAYGQLGNGVALPPATAQFSTPQRVVQPLQTTFADSVSLGDYHTCAWVQGGNGYCWGYDYYGQLGDAAVLPDGSQSTPTQVSGAFSWNSISGGGLHTCGVVMGGTGYCWGYNFYGQLGNNVTPDVAATPNQNAPVAVFGGLVFTSLSAGSYHSCGVTNSFAGYCWGYNGNGQLGDDSQIDRGARVQVAGGLSFVAIKAGGAHTCARTSATLSVLYCWGASYSGQIGDGARGSIRKVPARVVQ